MSDVSTAPPASETTKRNASSPWAAHGTWLALAILVFAPTIDWLWHRWTMDVWHNVHGLFIPFVMAYVGWTVLRADRVSDREQSAWGFLFLIPGLGLIVLDSAIGSQLLSAVGMLVCLPGFSLLLLGCRRTRELSFVWILSIFMLPIPATFVESFLLLLRRITAVGTEYVIALFGVPVAREDTILFIPRGIISINEGCSGFSVLYGSVALASVLAYMNSSRRARMVTLALAAPIAIACNVLRCSTLGLLVEHWGGGILDTAIHPFSGMLTFAAMAALLTYVGTLRPRDRTT